MSLVACVHACGVARVPWLRLGQISGPWKHIQRYPDSALPSRNLKFIIRVIRPGGLPLEPSQGTELGALPSACKVIAQTSPGRIPITTQLQSITGLGIMCSYQRRWWSRDPGNCVFDISALESTRNKL